MNSTTLYFLILASLGLSMLAQALTKSAYNRYSKAPASCGLTGGEVARRILEKEGIQNVSIEAVNGTLTDHYDPSHLVLRLSSSTMYGTSVAAIGVAAHETGHVLQHRDAYKPLDIRNACVKTVGFGSRAAWPIFLVGLLLSFRPLIYLGIGLYAAIVAFSLITLPVEFNASRRALDVLTADGYLAGDETEGAQKVLSAAALTYVASALTAILQLLRLISIAQGNNRRRR